MPFGTALGQYGPGKWSGSFKNKEELLRLYFHTRRVPDSTLLVQNIGVVWFKHPVKDSVFLSITNSGAILAYRDRKGTVALRLEKRNVFPFRKLENESRYLLECRRFTGPEAYLACRLLVESEDSVLDEVFLCLPRRNLEIKGIRFPESSWISPDM